MIRLIPLTILFFCIQAAHAQVKKNSVESTVKNVTIFSSGARVERIAAVSVSAGRTEISFTGLSNQLDQQSIQLQADASITLLSVHVNKDYLNERKIDEEEKNFIDHIAALKDKLDVDGKMLEVYKNEEMMLLKNQTIGGQQGVKPIDLKEALDLQHQRLTDIYMKELEIQKRIADEQQKMNSVKQQLTEISRKKDSINNIVIALVDSKTAKTVNFQLFYNVKDAGWYPTYDVRLSDLSHPLDIMMNANVFQRSGETWKNVSLLLSTGNPNDNATLSTLQPWYLGFYDPSILFNNRSAIPGTATGRVTNNNGEPIAGATVMIKGSRTGVQTDVNGFFKIQNFSNNGILTVNAIGYQPKEIMAKAGYYSIVLKASVNALQEVAVTGYAPGLQVSDGDNESVYKKKSFAESIQTVSTNITYQPTTLIYKLEDNYTLETDGKTITISMKELNIPAVYQYYAVPKIDPYSFLTAQILNWQDFDLQSGEASLYFEGSYLGKTYLDLGAQDDTLSLSMGKDNGVKIYRKLVNLYSSRKFMGSNRTDTRKYEITVQNTKHDSVSITVTDQFPVSSTKEITVEDEDAPEGLIDKNTGIVTWKLILPPGNEKKLTISYSVKYPKDRKLNLD